MASRQFSSETPKFSSIISERSHPGVMATAVAITPGWLRSEMMLENFGVSEENWRDAIGSRAPTDFAFSESPRYVGRAVAALAADRGRSKWNQKSVSSGQLAREYGFTDIDGSQPDIWRHMLETS